MPQPAPPSYTSLAGWLLFSPFLLIFGVFSVCQPLQCSDSVMMTLTYTPAGVLAAWLLIGAIFSARRIEYRFRQSRKQSTRALHVVPAMLLLCAASVLLVESLSLHLLKAFAFVFKV